MLYTANGFCSARYAGVHSPVHKTQGHMRILSLVCTALSTLPSVAPASGAWLPPLSGPYAVGTVTLFCTDRSRAEEVTRDTSDRRRLVVHVYYPAAHADSAKPFRRYLDDYPEEAYKLARRFLRLSPDYFLDTNVNVPTQARYGAEAADSGGPFPVVTVSHGYLSSPIVQTHLCELLAGNGYIAAAINHTYESTGAAFPDGTRTKPVFRFLRKAVFQGFEMPFIFAAGPGPRKDRMTRRVIDRSRAMNRRARVWEDDISFVLGMLDSMGAGLKGPLLRGKVDPSTTAAVGHSFGGTAAGFACGVNPRIRCAVNMEGFQYGLPPEAPYNGAVLLIESDQFAGVNDMVYTQVSPFYRIHIAGARHTGLTDVSMWPGLGKRRFRKRVGREGIAGIIDTYVLDFLDLYCKGKPGGKIEEIRRSEAPFPAAPLHERPGRR
jgi:dienelactone hydrolase